MEQWTEKKGFIFKNLLLQGHTCQIFHVAVQLVNLSLVSSIITNGLGLGKITIPSFSLDIFSTTVTLLGTNSSPLKLHDILFGMGPIFRGKLLVLGRGPAFWGSNLMQIYGKFEGFPLEFSALFGFFLGRVLSKRLSGCFFSNICSFHTYLGKGSILTHIFQTGLAETTQLAIFQGPFCFLPRNPGSPRILTRQTSKFSGVLEACRS